MHGTDFSYANDVRAAAELRTPRTARMLLISVLALIFVGLIWSYFAVLDEVTRGEGRIIPVRQLQVIQSLEGGIVRDILIKEGEIVDEGQRLMRIDDTKFSSELGEVRERRAALAARVARLEAEVSGNGPPVFDRLGNDAPAAVAVERSLFQARAHKLSQDIDVLVSQESRLTESYKLISREVELTRKLYTQKVVPEIEMLRLERGANEIKGQLTETQSKIASIKATFRQQVEEDLTKSRGDLAALDENIKSARDRVERAELRSPVKGVINKLNITTIGAVVQSGASLMEIVPLDDTLLVEGRIRPQDIAFVRQGQMAVVKITAYDSSVYGSLKGHVERVSADTIVDEKVARPDRNETFYRVIVRTEKNHLGTANNSLPIIPGMVATVEILTGHKSVLDYMIKPARLLRNEALRER